MEIDLSAIRRNCIEVKRRLAGGVRLMAQVASDAYGHGAVRCAKMALNSGADYLGVATVDEAIELREALINAPVLVLSEPPLASIPLLLAYKIMPSVYTAEFAIQYAEAADSVGMRAPFHLAVNTGMNRIGVRFDEVVSFMHRIRFPPCARVGRHVHAARHGRFVRDARFPDPGEALRGGDRRVARRQRQPRHRARGQLRGGHSLPRGALRHGQGGLRPLRIPPVPQTRDLINLEPAMSVHARIIDAKIVPMSEGVGYGMRYRSPGSVKICTVPVGYADGLPCALSGNTDFLVDGKAFRQVGSICMDQCMFEVDLRTYATRSASIRRSATR